MEKHMTGHQSVCFEQGVFVTSSAAVGGEKEGQGPLRDYFDLIAEDNMLGAETWEEAESYFQINALRIALRKANLTEKEIRYLLSGDLLGQMMASTFGCGSAQIPMFGLYGACSTCGEALSLGSMLVSAGYAKHVACVTSSHFASAEKEFRNPLNYGSQRPLSATWTVCGSGAYILSSEKQENCHAKITGVTTGIVTDYEIKDSMNMGAAMAPAAAQVIAAHFRDFSSGPEDYDQIITGDLGVVGQQALFYLLKDQGYNIMGKHSDCGIEIYGREMEEDKASDCGLDTHSGGSGCGCAATVLATKILRNIVSGVWRKVLFVPTGALLSKTSFNEGKTIPGIAHGVRIEKC